MFPQAFFFYLQVPYNEKKSESIAWSFHTDVLDFRQCPSCFRLKSITWEIWQKENSLFLSPSTHTQLTVLMYIIVSLHPLVIIATSPWYYLGFWVHDWFPHKFISFVHQSSSQTDGFKYLCNHKTTDHKKSIHWNVLYAGKFLNTSIGGKSVTFFFYHFNGGLRIWNLLLQPHLWWTCWYPQKDSWNWQVKKLFHFVGLW